jgi:hypothetical protein
MERLPLAERSLLDTPALSWSPGHTPTHEASWAADGNAAACGPISAMICCAESICFTFAPLREESAARWLRADR